LVLVPKVVARFSLIAKIEVFKPKRKVFGWVFTFF